MADFLTEKRDEIEARLNELRPLVEEYGRLEAAQAALEGVNGAAPVPQAARAPRTARTGKRGRPKGSGTRGAEALALVKATPGITIPDIAAHMGIKQNYLYRVLPGLEADGLVVRDGKGWRAKD